MATPSPCPEPRFRRLSVAAFVYAGLSLCLVAFMTVQLTTVVGLTLIQAGQILAAYQLAGSISRPIWGWIADRFLTPAQTLAVLGAGTALCSALTGLYGRIGRPGRCWRTPCSRAAPPAVTPASPTPNMPPWRLSAHQGNRPAGHRDHVRRRHGRPRDFRRGGDGDGRLSR